MGKYSKIQKRIWNDPTFNRLSEDAKLLWFYLLSCPHGNTIGLFVLKPGYACADLGWSEERFREALQELSTIPLWNRQGKGLISYDEDTYLLLIKNYLEHNPLANPNQVKAAKKRLEELPISPLFQELKQLLEELGKPLYQPLLEWLNKQLSKPVTDTDEQRKPEEDISNDSINHSPPLEENKPSVKDKDVPHHSTSTTKPKRKSKTFSEDSKEYRLAKLLLDCILEHRPNFKRPNLQSWAKHIDLMIRVDKRSPEEIEEVIRWCQNDSFWQANILSTKKLREKFDQLAIKMQKQKHSMFLDEMEAKLVGKVSPVTIHNIRVAASWLAKTKKKEENNGREIQGELH